jgi:hypothetical protein
MKNMGNLSVIVRKLGQGIYPITNIVVEASLFSCKKEYTDELVNFESKLMYGDDCKLYNVLYGQTEVQHKPCNNDTFMKFEFERLKIVKTSYQLGCKMKLRLTFLVDQKQKNRVDRMILGYIESTPIHVYSHKYFLPENQIKQNII